ncbi:MAG: S41 family peptidase [Thermoflexales bacterium]|nr:S41 family peptidase [Thermoflexales bacterium]
MKDTSTRRRTLGRVAAGLLLFGLGLGVGLALAPQVRPAAPQRGVDAALMQEALGVLDREWFGQLPDNATLTNGAIRGMVATLGDDFTAYVEPKYARMLSDDIGGSFEGIGATLRSVNGAAIQIVRVFEGSPASRAGVRSGDSIERVDDVKVSALSATEVAALIRGRSGTPVTLHLRREGEPRPILITVTRATIVIPLVSARLIGSGSDAIAYVSLFDFSANARQQLETQLNEVLAKKPRGLILDLRDNPGGLLTQAIEVGDLFLDEGAFLIERDPSGNRRQSNTTARGLAQNIPLVVLVNGGTASAAEIVAGAVQDRGRGQVLGETTFGKGSVQRPETLTNGAQLRVTIERWYTPNDRAVQGAGIVPDLIVARSAEDSRLGRDPQLDAALAWLLTGQRPAPTP